MIKSSHVTGAISQALQILESKDKIEIEEKQQLESILRSALYDAEQYGRASRISRYRNRY
jgi:hypothetical protein